MTAFQGFLFGVLLIAPRLALAGDWRDVERGDRVLVVTSAGAQSRVGVVLDVAEDALVLDVGGRQLAIPGGAIDSAQRISIDRFEPANAADVAAQRACILSGTGVVLPWMLFFASLSSADAGPFLLGIGGIVIGPSMGHFSAGAFGLGIATSAGRFVSMIALTAGLLYATSHCHEDDEPGCSEPPEYLGPSLMAAGAIGLVGLTIFDVVHAPRAARRNHSRRAAIAPMPVVARGRVGPGVALSLRF